MAEQFAACSSAGLNTQGRQGISRMYQSRRSVYCQAVLPSGGELGSDHPMLHSADKVGRVSASSWRRQPKSTGLSIA